MLTYQRVTLVLVLMLGAPADLHAQVVAPDSAGLHTYFARAEQFGLSAAVLVKRQGRTIVHAAYGWADHATRARLTVESPMFIGSLTKPITATAALRLVDAKRLSLDDSVATYFRDAPSDKRGITVRQLLTHTAGLPYLAPGMFGTSADSQLIRTMLSLPRTGGPPSYAYSSPGYIILAGIISRAAGEPFETFVTREIFQRARMPNTGFISESARWSRSGPMVSRSDGQPEPPLAGLGAMTGSTGAGGIVSTVGDLARWWEAVLEGSLLSPQSRALMLDAAVPSGNGTSVTLGMNVLPTRQGTSAVLHAGDLGGYNAELRWYPTERVLAVVASNVRAAGVGHRVPVMSVVRRLVAGDSLPVPPLVRDSATAQIALEGQWRVAENDHIRVWRNGARVLVGADGPVGLSLLAALRAPNAADSAVIARVTAQTQRLGRAIGAGDSTVAYALLHPSIPSELRAGFLSRWGVPLGSRALTSVRAIVTVPTGANTFVSYIASGDGATRRVVGVHWSGDAVTLVDAPNEMGGVREFRIVRDQTIVAYDLFTERLILMEADEREGTVSITSPAGRAQGTRQSRPGASER
jgi:CubicO group peptidase (beta-lactamase class C family)